MNKNTICLSMAVSQTGSFESKHFGEADKYLIYEWIEDELKNRPDEFNLFTISNGILKTRIKKVE